MMENLRAVRPQMRLYENYNRIIVPCCKLIPYTQVFWARNVNSGSMFLIFKHYLRYSFDLVVPN
jgi:hypothetical protein